MRQRITYHAGHGPRPFNIDFVIDAIADQVLSDGDVDRALQRLFRLGSEDEMGLLDILDRLREEASDVKHELDLDRQHSDDEGQNASEQRRNDALAMREALRQVESLDDLQGIDPELMNRSLTSDEMEWIEKWSDMKGALIDAGLVAQTGARLQLTARAIRRIGAGILRNMYLPPQIRGRGSHAIHRPGTFGTPGDERSEWEWGLPLDLDVTRSLVNSISRGKSGGRIGLHIDDFVVQDRVSAAAYSTVLMLDMSRSMFESGAWDVAKRAAMALDTLNTATHRHDQLELVGFAGDARQLTMTELPMLNWDQFSHGTNLHAGLQIARRLLKQRRSSNRHIVVVTDGEPTAYMDHEQPIFENPVTERTTEATLLEARRASRDGIAMTIVAVGDELPTVGFAQHLIRCTSGRLIHLPIADLGRFVVQDIGSGSIRLIH